MKDNKETTPGFTLHKGEELFTKTPVENTPFTIITINETGKSFGTFGQWKITPDTTDIKQLTEDLQKITWNRIIQISSIITKILTNPK